MNRIHSFVIPAVAFHSLVYHTAAPSPHLPHPHPPPLQRHRVCVSHYQADEFYMEAGGPLCRFCQQVGCCSLCLWVLHGIAGVGHYIIHR